MGAACSLCGVWVRRPGDRAGRGGRGPAPGRPGLGAVLGTGDAARRRPAPEVWSPLEYACHLRDVARLFDTRLRLMLTTDEPRFDDWDQDAAAIDGRYGEQDPARVAEELAAACVRLARAFEAGPAPGAGAGGVPLGRRPFHRRRPSAGTSCTSSSTTPTTSRAGARAACHADRVSVRVIDGGDDGVPDPVLALVGFARALRSAGLPVTPDRTQAFVRAASAVGPGSAAVYWAGRATLCPDPELVQRYDEVFRDWFGGELPRRGGGPRRTAPVRTSVLPDDGPGGVSRADAQRETEIVRARASAADVLRHRDVAELTAAEQRPAGADVRDAAPGRPAAAAPCAGSRGTRGSSTPGAPCARSCAAAASPAGCAYRRPRTRPRRVVLLVDVSGSMTPVRGRAAAPGAPSGYAARRAAPRSSRSAPG